VLIAGLLTQIDRRRGAEATIRKREATLVSMEERAHLVGGNVRMVSEIGRGTTVRVRAPADPPPPINPPEPSGHTDVTPAEHLVKRSPPLSVLPVRMSVDRLRAFASAAAAFFVARPWDHLTNEDLLIVEGWAGPAEHASRVRTRPGRRAVRPRLPRLRRGWCLGRRAGGRPASPFGRTAACCGDCASTAPRRVPAQHSTPPSTRIRTPQTPRSIGSRASSFT
jgi:hypothetical protein